MNDGEKMNTKGQVSAQELQDFHDAVRPVGADKAMELWGRYCVPVLNVIDRVWAKMWGDNKGMSGVY